RKSARSAACDAFGPPFSLGGRMYYEEKVIDGVLHKRTTPDGAWVAFTSIELTEMYLSVCLELERNRREEMPFGLA
ncbi:MAG TPA: hypothetical protein VJZ94_00590, partial [Candidatus Paceibacterota bacterium]|nr:hypothetical protein [Candidatus Paceibacterota bacterium]